MIARDKIVIGMPVHNFLIDAGCVSGLIACAPLYARPIFYGGNSYVSLARDRIVHTFQHDTTAEWLVWIDSDTEFTPQDWQILWEMESDPLVCCAYSRKFLGAPPVQWGLGFTRVHRSVYEKIDALSTDDGQERVPKYFFEGRLLAQYHPQGIMGPESWLGEDQGFFLWAREAGITPRFETRTRLGHAGRMVYGFPEQIPATMLESVIAQMEDHAKRAEEDGAQ